MVKIETFLKVHYWENGKQKLHEFQVTTIECGDFYNQLQNYLVEDEMDDQGIDDYDLKQVEIFSGSKDNLVVILYGTGVVEEGYYVVKTNENNLEGL